MGTAARRNVPNALYQRGTCILQADRQPRPLSKSVFGTLDTVSATQPTVVLRRKRAHTGFSFDHPGSESHFADEVCPSCCETCCGSYPVPRAHDALTSSGSMLSECRLRRQKRRRRELPGAARAGSWSCKTAPRRSRCRARGTTCCSNASQRRRRSSEGFTQKRSRLSSILTICSNANCLAVRKPHAPYVGCNLPHCRHAIACHCRCVVTVQSSHSASSVAAKSCRDFAL